MISLARLFVSYKSEEQAYAFALRQWLIDRQGWADRDVFVDKGHLSAGKEWESMLLSEAETAEAMLFLASEASIDIRSFCYRELRAAKGQIIAVTLKGLAINDDRLLQALPERAKARQIEALDQQPVEGFDFVSPKDNTRGTIGLNRRQVESIGSTLRDLGIAPDSFRWTPCDGGPFPGLAALQEGDEAIFCGRSIDIRDGLRALDDMRASVTEKALLIQAPSGAGKSSFLRAGLWQRLRRSAAFTPLAIIRTDKGAVRNPTWGLVAGLYDTLTKVKALRQRLPLSRAELAARVSTDLHGLLKAFFEADTTEGQPRSVLLGIDQAEEMTNLSDQDAAELSGLLRLLFSISAPPDIRLVLTVRDDSLDATRERLIDLGLRPEAVATWRLNRLPRTRLAEIINGPAEAARQAGWPLALAPELAEALALAAGESSGEGGDALPIIAVALQRLVVDHRAPTGEITLPVAEARAFLSGAVENAVAKAQEMAKATVDDLRRLIIPRLATWDSHAGGEGAAKRVVASAEQLFDGDRAHLKPLADALIAQRLLTSSKTDTGAVYEVAHEALLRVAPLGQLIFERREKFEHERMLLAEAREWVASGKLNSRLGRSADRLMDSEALLADEDFGPDLRLRNPNIVPYLEACATLQQAARDDREKLLRTLQAESKRADQFIKLVSSNPAGLRAMRRICSEAIEVTNSLSITTNADEYLLLSDRFWELYYGPMYIVEIHQAKNTAGGRGIEVAMVKFGRRLASLRRTREPLPHNTLISFAAKVRAECVEYLGTPPT